MPEALNKGSKHERGQVDDVHRHAISIHDMFNGLALTGGLWLELASRGTAAELDGAAWHQG